MEDYLEGMQTQLVHFQNSIEDAIGQGGSPGNRSVLDVDTPDINQLNDVKSKFENARTTIESNLPHFKDPLDTISQNPNFKSETVQVTLPLYTTAATLNLLLHQGYIQFMERWKAVYGNQYNSIVNINRVKLDLQQRIQEYTETVFQVFKQYIPDIGPNKLQHNIHNRYVRSMQINALDIVAMWPTLDPTNYNQSTDLDQSRLIFADAVGPDEWHDGNITIYNILDGAPFNRHSQIGLDSIYYSRDDLQKVGITQYSYTGNNNQYCWPYGFRLFYTNQTCAYGDNDPGNPQNVWNAPVSTVNAITQYVRATNLDAENIIIDSGSTGCFLPGYPGVEGYAQSKNVPIANHKVDALYPIRVEHVAGAQGKLGLLPSLIPADLESQNKIGVPDANGNFSIRGIPAEKYTHNDGTVIREYINGANVVRLSYFKVVTLKIYNATDKKYQIRLRYATSGDASIWFHIINDSNQQDIINGNNNFPAPAGNKMYVNGANGQYVLNAIGTGSGQLPLDAPFYDLPLGNLTILIQNTGSADLYLDRIEFVPGY
ncbi:insecticidal delta-endotoxin Cry8Ea1 family protein [Brevibacillus formosus]|uniref:insecticidal delta-endotoxin Cry8Ea1 family protein n=2 Tax=Brevibacillus formosus TaxID=54913 RepID=UPI003F1C875E